MRHSSSGWPKPGRRHQPARLSHARSCSAERRRPLARSISASNRRRSSGVSQRSRAQQVFEVAAQLAHFAALDLLVAAAEDAVDALDGSSSRAAGRCPAVGTACLIVFQAPRSWNSSSQRWPLPSSATQCTSSVPTSDSAAASCTGILRSSAAPGAQHGGDGRQAHESPGCSSTSSPGLRPSGSDVEETRWKRTGRPSAARSCAQQATSPAGLPRGSRQTARGLSGARFVEQQEVAARRTAFDGRREALARQRIGDAPRATATSGSSLCSTRSGLAAPADSVRPALASAAARNTPPFSSSVSGTGRRSSSSMPSASRAAAHAGAGSRPGGA
jgi:hypothetical protein